MRTTYIANITLYLMLLISCITDCKYNTVKNFATFPCILAGLFLSSLNDSLPLLDSVKGVLIPLILLLPFYLLGTLGAGDIKLFCGVGALMGSSFVTISILYSFLLAGVMSLILMTYRGVITERLSYLLNYIMHFLLYLQLQPYTDGKAASNKLPLAVAVMGGVIVTNVLM